MSFGYEAKTTRILNDEMQLIILIGLNILEHGWVCFLFSFFPFFFKHQHKFLVVANGELGSSVSTYVLKTYKTPTTALCKLTNASHKLVGKLSGCRKAGTRTYLLVLPQAVGLQRRSFLSFIAGEICVRNIFILYHAS